MRKVEVVPHKKIWSNMFQEESKKLKALFGEEVLNVYHIGSTAIPSIKAKPIIDIMVEVKSIKRVDEYRSTMKQIGYEAKGEFGIPGRRFFIKGGNERTHHVHMFEKGNSEIDRHLAFRDYLIAHPKEARNYSKLKEELAMKFPFDMEKYIDGKNAYIKEIDKRAKANRQV